MAMRQLMPAARRLDLLCGFGQFHRSLASWGQGLPAANTAALPSFSGLHQDGQLQLCSLMNKLRILVHGQFGSSCSMSTEVQRRRKSARTVERDPTSTSRSMKNQGVLVHALSGRVKFLGVYIAAVAISRQRQRELKGLDRRRRIIHRLRMLQKQRQNSWEKETERLVLGAWIRGYRKAIDSLKSHQTARQAIVDKATELGMRMALTLTEGAPHRVK
jgi:hypothetical protein